MQPSCYLVQDDLTEVEMALEELQVGGCSRHPSTV